MKYRKKLVIVEAEQWFPGKYVEGVITEPPTPESDRGVSNLGDRLIYWKGWTVTLPCIDTLEGPHAVSPGDWIVTGVKGEKYPVKPDIFHVLYEAV